MDNKMVLGVHVFGYILININYNNEIYELL